MVTHRAYVDKERLESSIERAVQKLGPEVVRIRHSVGEDTSGEPSLYFRIILTDSASRGEALARITGGIEDIIFDEIHPYEDWDLRVYFSYRSQSEQADRNDPAWA